MDAAKEGKEIMNDKKKAAIMTWYTYRNYGSVLQATALYQVINSMGYEPSFIHYLPKGTVSTPVKRNIINRLINKISSIHSQIYMSPECERLYDDYLKKRTRETDLCASYPELKDLTRTHDVFICGSDQIWSPLCYDSKFFLDFVEDSNKMVAYAPSLGSTEITDPIIRENMISHISRFKHLSVRELQGAELIKSITGQDAEVVLDPTLLMDTSEWDIYAQVGQVQKLRDNEYIICYFLGDESKYMEYVRMLSKNMNVPYYVIPFTVKQKKSRDAVPFEVGPCEFVSLIRNAKYVVTDSFHGMAFSVNYNIPFSVFKRFKENDPKNQNSRIFSLLQLLGLENCLVDYQNKRGAERKIECDFLEANYRLNIKRKESLEYLRNALVATTGDSCVQEKPRIKITDMCCGCGACATVCGKGAVSISRNAEGFEYYSIDISKCVGCGQCQTVCPMTGIIAPDMKESQALYSAKSNCEETLKKSSSGGTGHDLASYLLNDGYAVCGCMYDIANNIAKHVWVRPGEKEKLPLLQGSKYIQSNTANAVNVLLDIAKENKVAFFGTPCQAAAVDKILRQKGLRENAVIVDLICHGVPSYHLWDKYLAELNKKHNVGNHPIVTFRSKEHGWRRRLLLVTGNNHVYKKEEKKDDFYAFFRHGLCNMIVCSDCPYRTRSAADLRIGDYWGNRFAKDKQGVSMVIANTVLGDRVVEGLSINRMCQVEKQELSEYWAVQYPYNPQRFLARDQLIAELKDIETSLGLLRKKYCAYYEKREKNDKIIRFVKNILKRG